MGKLPHSLVSFDVLDELMGILFEKENLRRELTIRNFGERVTDDVNAHHLLKKISLITGELLPDTASAATEPTLVLTQRMSRLPRAIFTLYLLFIPLAAFFIYLTVLYSGDSAAEWLVRVAIIFLLVFPLILYRRMRINIEHECTYRRNTSGQAMIFIDQLPATQFQSYLSHEFAHHLYYSRCCGTEEKWVREGWCRLLQWEVAGILSQREQNPAYRYHVLLQVIGELKFACVLISMALRINVPASVRRIRTIYHYNSPLKSFFTGTPGFNVDRLIDHGIGTAVAFLAAQRVGLTRTLDELPVRKESLMSARDNGHA